MTWLKLFIVLLSLGAIVSCGKSQEELAQDAKHARLQEEKRKAEEEERITKTAMAVYQQLLLDNLKDPSSAQFKNLRLVTGEGGEALCGEVNAKNAFGGYTGFKPFVVTEERLQHALSNIVIGDAKEDWMAKANEILFFRAGCGKF